MSCSRVRRELEGWLGQCKLAPWRPQAEAARSDRSSVAPPPPPAATGTEPPPPASHPPSPVHHGRCCSHRCLSPLLPPTPCCLPPGPLSRHSHPRAGARVCGGPAPAWLEGPGSLDGDVCAWGRHPHPQARLAGRQAGALHGTGGGSQRQPAAAVRMRPEVERPAESRLSRARRSSLACLRWRRHDCEETWLILAGSGVAAIQGKVRCGCRGTTPGDGSTCMLARMLLHAGSLASLQANSSIAAGPWRDWSSAASSQPWGGAPGCRPRRRRCAACQQATQLLLDALALDAPPLPPCSMLQDGNVVEAPLRANSTFTVIPNARHQVGPCCCRSCALHLCPAAPAAGSATVLLLQLPRRPRQLHAGGQRRSPGCGVCRRLAGGCCRARPLLPPHLRAGPGCTACPLLFAPAGAQHGLRGPAGCDCRQQPSFQGEAGRAGGRAGWSSARSTAPRAGGGKAGWPGCGVAAAGPAPPCEPQRSLPHRPAPPAPPPRSPTSTPVGKSLMRRASPSIPCSGTAPAPPACRPAWRAWCRRRQRRSGKAPPPSCSAPWPAGSLASATSRKSRQPRSPHIARLPVETHDPTRAALGPVTPSLLNPFHARCGPICVSRLSDHLLSAACAPGQEGLPPPVPLSSSPAQNRPAPQPCCNATLLEG